MADRKEATNDIEVTVSPNETVTVETLTATEEFDVEQIYGSGYQFPSGYSIKQASISGDMTIKGNRKDLKDKFFDASGMPKVMDALTINHMEELDSDGNVTRDSTGYTEVICTNKGYEATDGETVETTFEWVAMGIDDDTGVDPDPADV